MIEADVSFGAWVASRRKALDLTREQVTECIGCSVSHLRKIEADERRPSRQIAELLARCVEIPPEERLTFVQVARGLDRVERLKRPQAGVEVAGFRPVPRPIVSNLPIPPTPLIGREPELAALARMLGDPQCRLLTVVGPGGIGKTRLAIEAAAAQRELFADGVYFVPLVSLTLPQFIVPAIADAVGFEFSGPVDSHAQLLNHLRGKSLLLVLDNFEHLLEAGIRLAQLLQQAPAVKLLITSRERLGLHGEWQFEIQGLPVPPLDQAEWAEQYSAVGLFVQSAERVQAGFTLNAGDRWAVSRICQLVDGMPLAIELAAAWVQVLDCAEIASEIERSLDFLVSDTRDLPERHHSLRAAFDHSWNLLGSEERLVLCRLAVFRGGFEREAAAQIAGASLHSLAALASKSLVRRSKYGRYDLHQVVRQYALSHLADDPQSELVRDRHCEFYLGLLREREEALKGATQRETLRELTDEIDNVRLAWDWAVQREKFLSLGPALRSFGKLFDLRGWHRDGIEQLERVVQGLRDGWDDEERQKVLGQALAQQGLLCFRQGRHDRAQTLFEESLRLLRPFGDPALLCDPLLWQGVIMFLCGQFQRAQSLTDDCLACARMAGDSWFVAHSLYNQGYIASQQGLYAEGYEQMSAGLALWRRLGDPRFTALGLNFLSPTAIKLGRYEEARAFSQESLALCLQVGDRWGIGTANRMLGLAALAQGNIPEAQALIRRSLDIFSEFVTGWDVVQSLVCLAEAALAAGDVPEARRIFLDALRMAVEAQAMPLALDALLGLAYLQAQAGEAEQALEMLVCVSQHTASTAEAKDRAECLWAELVGQLDPRQIEVAWAQAKAFEAVVEAILEGTPAATDVQATHTAD